MILSYVILVLSILWLMFVIYAAPYMWKCLISPICEMPIFRNLLLLILPIIGIAYSLDKIFK